MALSFVARSTLSPCIFIQENYLTDVDVQSLKSDKILASYGQIKKIGDTLCFYLSAETKDKIASPKKLFILKTILQEG